MIWFQRLDQISVKLTNNFYLDYNATSPLSKSVIDILEGGDLPFANPSSIHSFGKKNRRLIEDCSVFLFNYFNLSLKDYSLVYHSGATEGFHTFIHTLKAGDFFFFHATDHPMVKNAAKSLQSKGVQTEELPVSKEGNFNYSLLESKFNACSGRVFYNHNWVNNETGVINPLAQLKNLIKDNLFIHVDAVQTIGKIKDYTEVPSFIHFISYSSHKFGGLKGCGFSFVRKDYPYEPLFIGGGQQRQNRGGTENPLGVLSTQSALENAKKTWKQEELHQFRDKLEKLLKNELGDLITIFGENSTYGRACNTCCFALKNKKADETFIHFDLEGLMVSVGSACSSSTAKKSENLLAMGFDELSDHALRISLGPQNLDDQSQILKRFKRVLKSLN
jgi:cysteine desulfurase